MTNTTRVFRGFTALILAVIICAADVATTARALVDFDETFFSGNNITFYDPRCATQDNGKLVQLAGRDNTEKILNFFMRKGLSLEQSAGIVGNMMQESGLNPAIIQGGKIADDLYVLQSGVGFGLVQWTDGGRQQKFMAHMKSMGVGVTNLSGQLEFTWKEMNESYEHVVRALKSTQDPIVAAVIVHGRADSPSSDKKYAEAMMHLDNKRGYEISGDSGDTVVRARGGNAQKIYEKYSDAPALAGSTAASDMQPAGDGTDKTMSAAVSNPSTKDGNNAASCDSEGKFDGGNIYATIGAYAWSKHKGNDINARPAYREAVVKAKSEGRYVGGIRHTGIDCGGFVSLAIQDSGFDKAYNSGKGNTITQENWLKKPESKWEKLDPGAPKLTGDVAINEDHTYMYVDKTKVPKGEEGDFQTNIASASLDERSPMAGKEGETDRSFRWYRRKG